MTVKNEEALIRANLRFHHYIGLDRIYLYLDAPKDSTLEQVQDLPYAVIRNSVDPEMEKDDDLSCRGIGESVIRQHSKHHCARQILNMADACIRAGKEGYDWLVCIDADELICPVDHMPEPDALKRCLSAQSDETDAVSFQTLELLQYRKSYSKVVFAEETLFKRIRTENGGIIQTTQWLQRLIPDPIRKWRRLRPGFYYGHSEGKMAVRTRRGLVPRSVHRFEHPGRQSNVKTAPYLLHYMLYNLEDYIKKHRNFSQLPDRWMSGAAIPRHLRSWIKFVNAPGVTQEDIAHYYRLHVQYPQNMICEFKQMNPSPIIEIDEARRVFSRI